MPDDWTDGLFDDEPLGAATRLAVRERLRHEWNAPTLAEPTNGGAGDVRQARRRLTVAVAAASVVGLSIASLVWLANADDQGPPATNVPASPIPATAAPTAPTTPTPPQEPIDTSPIVVPAAGGEPLVAGPLGVVRFGTADGQIGEPVGPPVAVALGDRVLLLLETGADGAPTGKAVEVNRYTGDVTRTVTVPVPDARAGVAVYGSPNGVLYMAWPLPSANGLQWIAAIDVTGEYAVTAENVSGALEPSDPTLPTQVVRVSGEGVRVGDDLVLRSPLPAGKPQPRATWASDHLIEGDTVGTVEVALHDDNGYEATWRLDVQSDAVGVRGAESLDTHWFGAGALAVVQRPGAEQYFIELRIDGDGSGYRSDGWLLVGSDGPGASFVRRTATGIEIGGLFTMWDDFDLEDDLPTTATSQTTPTASISPTPRRPTPWTRIPTPD